MERRQKKVFGAAKKSTAIVSSLFPSTVRDRLFEEEREPGVSNKGPFHASQLPPVMEMYGGDDEITAMASGLTKRKGPAIADLFPEAVSYVVWAGLSFVSFALNGTILTQARPFFATRLLCLPI